MTNTNASDSLIVGALLAFAGCASSTGSGFDPAKLKTQAHRLADASGCLDAEIITYTSA